MNRSDYRFPVAVPALPAQPHDDPDRAQLAGILAAAKRQWRIVAILAACGLALGVVYLLRTTPRYTATTTLLIDSRQTKAFENADSARRDGGDENSIVDSQVEIIRSAQIAKVVVDKLRLVDRREQKAPGLLGSVKSFVMGWLTTAPEGASGRDDYRRTVDAIAEVRDNTTVNRAGKSFVIQVGYTATDPELATEIVNALVEAYVSEELDANSRLITRASAWLQQGIDGLKAKALQEGAEVAKFRADNQLVLADGKLVGEQQLSELNAALISAQAERAQIKARNDVIAKIVAEKRFNETELETINSPVAQALRLKYMDVAKREADISSRYGSDHFQAVQRRRDMDEYKRLIFDELTRVSEGTKSALKMADDRIKLLQVAFDALQKRAVDADATQVQLTQLKQQADVYQTQLQNFLDRYQSGLQQMSFPLTQARVISPALVPVAPSWPNIPIVLSLGVLLGGVAGCGIGAVREFRDRGFRTVLDVESVLQADCFGFLPKVDPKAALRAQQQATGTFPPRNGGLEYLSLGADAAPFIRVMRSIKANLDDSPSARACRTIGLVSALPSEGKSTVALNLATMLAELGEQVLLIDADFAHPSLTDWYGLPVERGLADVLERRHSLQQSIVQIRHKGLDFLPAFARRRNPHAGELIGSIRMRELLAAVGEQYGYVIVDLPPLAGAIEARLAARYLDGLMWVLEWGRTPRDLVASLLRANPMVAERTIGGLVNKADASRAQGYDPYYSAYGTYGWPPPHDASKGRASSLAGGGNGKAFHHAVARAAKRHLPRPVRRSG